MAINYMNPLFEVIRDPDRCIKCRVCERQCANEVHKYDPDLDKMISDEMTCVDCQRCVCLCPTHALKIRPNENSFRENANWSHQTMDEVYKQAGSGGVLLSAMGNPKAVSVYETLRQWGFPELENQGQLSCYTWPEETDGHE